LGGIIFSKNFLKNANGRANRTTAEHDKNRINVIPCGHVRGSSTCWNLLCAAFCRRQLLSKPP